MLNANNHAVTDVIHVATQVVVPKIQADQGYVAQLVDMGVEIPSPSGLRPSLITIASLKWIDYVMQMLELIEFVPTKREHKELSIHKMIRNALGWWMTIERALCQVSLASMIVEQFGTSFEDRFVHKTNKRHYKDEFCAIH